LRIAARGAQPLAMNRNAVIAIVLAIASATIATKYANSHAGVRRKIEREVADIKRRLPIKIDETTTQTRAELVGDTLQGTYSLDMTFETDPATTAAMQDGLRKQICTMPESVKVLELNFSIDTTFDVKTPHGPGQFHLLVAPRDCPGVTVKS